MKAADRWRRAGKLERRKTAYDLPSGRGRGERSRTARSSISARGARCRYCRSRSRQCLPRRSYAARFARLG